MINRWIFVAVAVGGAVWAMAAQASCGSTYCVLNTTWDEQGVLSTSGTRLDLRFEYVPQTQLRQGSRKIDLGEVASDHDEVKTYNRNWLATLQHSFDEKWSVTLAAPFVNRFHEHLDNGTTPATPEQWNFSRLGDMQVAVRYHPTPAPGSADAYGVRMGLKLPTGSINVSNVDRTRAERSLQPGTGSTDAVLGAFYHYWLDPEWLLFAQGSWQSAFVTRDHYRPGDKLGLDLGLNYTWSPRVTGLLQVNLLRKARDSGANAEPDQSGGRYAYLSPGLSVAAGHDVRVYGFYQQALYQHVNGVQLTSKRSLVFGVSARF